VTTQPTLWDDPPRHRTAGATERRAAKKARSSLSERRRQAILAEARFRKRYGVTQPELAVMLGENGHPLAGNKIQPRLAELGGYKGRDVLMVQTTMSRNGAHIWLAIEYAKVDEIDAHLQKAA